MSNFKNIIRYDFEDTATDTNEIEYGLTNRIYTRKYTEAVTSEAQRQLQENPDKTGESPLSIQPYEVFTLTVRGQIFFRSDIRQRARRRTAQSDSADYRADVLHFRRSAAPLFAAQY